MQREPLAPMDVSPAAHVHRMLKSDALPTHLHSVVDKQGSLTTSAGELEAVMVEHFQSVFALPSTSIAVTWSLCHVPKLPSSSVSLRDCSVSWSPSLLLVLVCVVASESA